MRKHIVKQGESLSKIARTYGLASYQALYEAPENATLRANRPNPNVLFPGDEVTIPDHREKTVMIRAGKLTRFRLIAPKDFFYLNIFVDRPSRYELQMGEEVFCGTIYGSRQIAHALKN